MPEGLRRHGSWQSEGVVVDEVAGRDGEEEVLIVRRKKRRVSGEGKEGGGVDEGVQAGEGDGDRG